MRTPAKKVTTKKAATKKAAVKKAAPLMQKSAIAKKKTPPVKQMETIKAAGRYLGDLKDKVVKRVSSADAAGQKAYNDSYKTERTVFTNEPTGSYTKNPGAYISSFASELVNPKTSKKKKR
jgi:N-acetylmuramoyl-L-alanine amidase CwlA